MAPIDDALKALGSQESPNYTEIAKIYNVNRSTLSKRHRGVTGSKRDANERNSLLSYQQQLDLVKYINTLSARGIPPTNAMVNNFAQEICGKVPSKNWCANFCKAHSNVLESDYLEGLDSSRKKADSAIMYSRYFEKVCRYLIISYLTNVISS
jgi:hypothetical protein